MSAAEYSLREIIQKKNQLINLRSELSELESDLCGMETKHEGNYAVVEHIDSMDGQVILYVEDEDGASWNDMITIYELLDKFK